ncbi:hypothetical protein SDJN03_29226, partial [Cucurbita argyrosperma subsp. sororia]
MQFGNEYVLGYWPSFLFLYLADSASMIEWGGEVVNSEAGGLHTLTQMGTGHFPEEGFGKTSYFRNIQVVDSSNNLKAPKGIAMEAIKLKLFLVMLLVAFAATTAQPAAPSEAPAPAPASDAPLFNPTFFASLSALVFAFFL